MKICISIAPNSMRDALRILKKIYNSTDLIEVRVDGIKDLNLQKLLQQPRPKIIITNRRKDEGGMFTGNADKQFEILSQAIHLGSEYVDIELSWGITLIKKLLSLSNKTKIICSYHNFKETPINLEKLYKRMQQTGAYILKIATTANDITDNKIIFDLLSQARRERQKMIVLCMGEYGQISRILGGKFGNYLTYASLNEKHKTASGQLAYKELKDIYRADQINSRTRVFGLVGNPVKNSKGIYYHNKIFINKNLNAVYVNFLVRDLSKFINVFKSLFTGISITMPFKFEIANFLDLYEQNALKVGTYNTVVKKNNKLIGINTDLLALISILRKRIKLNQKNIVVLGTGAIAKTIAYACILNKGDVTIVGRNFGKAQKLATELNCKWTNLKNLNKLSPDILINGTSVGMKGNPVKRIVPKSFLKKEMIVFDAVYNPIMTPLLQDALETGCKIITGLELFEKQAKLQSKLFIDNIQ